jgi:hypothetical protein
VRKMNLAQRVAMHFSVNGCYDAGKLLPITAKTATNEDPLRVQPPRHSTSSYCKGK